jgi:hypothetical protein
MILLSSFVGSLQVAIFVTGKYHFTIKAVDNY